MTITLHSNGHLEVSSPGGDPLRVSLADGSPRRVKLHFDGESSGLSVVRKRPERKPPVLGLRYHVGKGDSQ